jgi:hypothetical protein
VIEPHRLRDEVLAEHRRDTRVAFAVRTRMCVIHEPPLAAAQPDRHVEASERCTFDESLHLRELGPLCAQELAARGHVEKELADLDRRALRVWRGRGPRENAVRRRHGISGLRARRARDEADARHRGYRRQRFTAEPERAHRFEVLDAPDLAGRVVREREGELVARDAGAVVTHTAERDTAGLDIDLDATRAGIEAVLDQLFYDRRGTLYDLAGRDLVDQLFGQDPDGHATASRWGREDSKARWR